VRRGNRQSIRRQLSGFAIIHIGYKLSLSRQAMEEKETESRLNAEKSLWIDCQEFSAEKPKSLWISV
jgi:hypothetical protein